MSRFPFSFPFLKLGKYMRIFYYSVATCVCSSECFHWPCMSRLTFSLFCMSELISIPPQHVHSKCRCSHTFFFLWRSILVWRVVTISPPTSDVLIGHSEVGMLNEPGGLSTPKPCEITGDYSWPSSNLKSGTHAKLLGWSIAELAGAGGVDVNNIKHHDNRIGA